jgi:pimeloyl-ACP methyl ester carboxylesterase
MAMNKAINHILLLTFLFACSFSLCEQPDCGVAIKKVSRFVSKKEELSKNLLKIIRDRNTHQTAASVIKEYDPDLQTMVHHTFTEPGPEGSTQLVDPKAKAVVIFLHGSGTMRASGKNFSQPMSALEGSGISSVSFDFPDHGEGPKDSKFRDANVFYGKLHDFITKIRKVNPNIYLTGHSFGPEIALEYSSRYPEDIKGLLLMSPASDSNPALKWTYENITVPGEPFMGGPPIAHNEKGGEWAGSIQSQSTWQKKPFPKGVKIKFVIGKEDEFWPGNTALPKALGKTNPYTFDEALKWYKEKYPKADFVIPEGVGHLLFDAKAANGKNLVVESIYDLLEIPPSDRYKDASHSARHDLLVLQNSNAGFREWIGNRFPHALKTERRAAQELTAWEQLQWEAAKHSISKLPETDPEFFSQRKYAWGVAMARIPKLKKEVTPTWDGGIKKFLADYTQYTEKKVAGKPIDLGPDPDRPAKFSVDKSKILFRGKKGSLERDFYNALSEEELSALVTTAHEDALRKNNYQPLIDKWEGEAQGRVLRVKVGKGSVAELEIVGN